MPSDTERARRVTMPEVCRCGHAAKRHLAVLDGECVAAGCRCRALTGQIRESAPHHVPTAVRPAAQRAAAPPLAVEIVEACRCGHTQHPAIACPLRACGCAINRPA